jgi:transcriptional regulator with XRE-family HTH domain
MTKTKFRQLLKYLGVSQGKLARETGQTRTSIGNYFNGRRPINTLMAWGLNLKVENEELKKHNTKLSQRVHTLNQRTKN